MAKIIVKTILVVLCLLLEVHCDWSPLSSPYVSDYPCIGTNSIVSFFEPGVSSKAKTRYSVSINETFPTNSSIQIAFDSEAYITLLVKTDDKRYSRVTMEPGVVFGFYYFAQETGFNFVVTSFVPGIVPYITSVIINNEEYCQYPNVGFLNQYVVETLLNDEEKNCGRRQVQSTQLMVNGANTKPGDWPWHVAIYKQERNIIKYICGGTLVSKNFVLTAAHCVSVRGSALLPDTISVVLGKYNLFGGDFGSEEKEVHKIIIHQKFEHRTLNNDIALIELNTEVTFSDYIQPSCLWYKKAIKKLPSNQIMGTVVGWGFDNSGTLSRTLKQAKMPIVSDNVCIRSKPLFYANILNGNKFCAGFHNGTSACNGDSGGALVVFVPDTAEDNDIRAEGTWHVKGIVSMTLSQKDVPVCDPEQYVVFTDVEKYRVWIKSYIKEKENEGVL
ncbi:chymotrypsin-like elastase family member 2A isoform X1 [Danaus plexippus]|uniref:chymotrypsin-like elastase family member 2A isoform X1 n=1 Tax=Danaus plexippus TaxID=13037 RepID=UPI002AB19848|nr:chymotrypsin-like elastase family member 2A isoform X1 [Danaus plexippus]